MNWSYAEPSGNRGENVVANDYDLAWDPARGDDIMLWTLGFARYTVTEKTGGDWCDAACERLTGS